MNSPKKITITVTDHLLLTVAAQMRRIPPHNNETDNFIADVVHWFEHLANENNHG